MQPVQVYYPTSFLGLKRLQYVLSFLNHHPLNKYYNFITDSEEPNKISIGYGLKGKNLFIPKSENNFLSSDIETENYKANTYSWLKGDVLSVEKKVKSPIAFFEYNSFSFDIFNTIFFHISRYEEVFAEKNHLGQSGWLEEDRHLLIHHKIQDRPVIDELVLAFIQSLGANIKAEATSYDISHDIDILGRFTPFYKWVRSLGATLYYQRGFKQFANSIAHYQKMLKGEEKDPYDTFHFLLRAEQFWQSKHIYFMAGGNTKYDNHYQLKDKRLDKILLIAKDLGYNIGIHPSYNAGFQNEMYKQEKELLEEKLNQPITWNRQHWLRFNWNVTPEIWNKQGITQDASMGYNRYLGFRCGTGFAYHMYDFKTEQAYSWKEQPMAFMESSAIHQAKASEMELSELMKDFLVKNKQGTHISFNFHNSNFDPLLTTGRTLFHFYQNELLELIAEN